MSSYNSYINDYYTSVWGHISTNNNAVFTGVTIKQELGGIVDYASSNWYTSDSWRPFYTALDMYGNNALLTIGGVNNEDPGYKYNFCHNGENLQGATEVIKFASNGYLNFTAHTGGAILGTDQADANSIVSDSKISIRGVNSYTRKIQTVQQGVMVNQDVSVTGIKAEKLTVISDMSGTIDVDSSITNIQGWKIASKDSAGKDTSTYTDMGSSNTAVASALKVAEVEFKNNFTATLDAATTVKATGYKTPVINSNNLGAYGVNATGAVTLANGYWGGKIKTSVNGNNLLGDEALCVKESTPTRATASVNSNILNAIGVTAASMNVKDISGQFQSSANSNTFDAAADGNSTTTTESNGTTTTTESVTASSGTVSGNTITAAGIKVSGSVDLGSFTGDILADASNNKFEATASSKQVSGGSTGTGGSSSTPTPTSCTATVSNNVISVYGIMTDGALKVEDFGGSISATANNNTFTAKGVSDKSTVSVTGNTVTVAAIKSKGLTVENDFTANITASITGLTASQSGDAGGNGRYPIANNRTQLYGMNIEGNLVIGGNMYGSISVTAKNWTSVLTNTSAPNNKYDVFALKANTITVNGFMGGVIKTNTATSPTNLGGVATGTITADAFTGSISSNAALSVSQALRNNDDGVFDIAGDIYGLVVGVQGFSQGMKMRVSGSISIGYNDYGYAIAAGTVNGKYNISNTSRNDFLEVAAGAEINGDIDLTNGENTIIIDSNARINGSLVASAGKLNLTFMLNDKAMSHAVNETSASDTTLIINDNGEALVSTASVAINLNDVVLDGDSSKTYYLAKDKVSGWDNRRIAFVYQNKMQWTNVGERVVVDGAFTVSSQYNASTGIFSVTVESIEDAGAAFGAVQNVCGTMDAEAGLLELTWDTVANAAKYEVEYSIDGGKSITVMLDAKDASFKLDGLISGQSVDYRVRAHFTEYRSFSAWSTTDSLKLEAPAESTEVGDIDTSAVKITTENTESATVTSSAVVTLSWDGFVCQHGLKYYEVRYYSSEQEINALDWDTLSYGSSKNYYHKYTTANELVMTGLNDSEFLYWQIRCIDNNGFASEWIDVNPLKMVSDTIAPVLKDVESSVSFDASKMADEAGFLNGHLAWEPAYDNEGGAGVRDYVIKYRKEGSEDWVVVTLDNSNLKYTVALGNGAYEWEFYSSDYSDNASVIQSGKWLGDNTAPEMSNVLTAAVAYVTVSGSTDPCDVSVTIDWKPAKDFNDGGNAGSGVAGYIISYYDAESSSWIEAGKVAGDVYSYTHTLTNGDYQWKVQAFDSVNNVADGVTVWSYGDSKGPEFTGNQMSWSVSWLDDQDMLSVKGSWSAAADAESGLAGYLLTYTNVATGEEFTKMFGPGVTSCAITVKNGQYTWKLAAVDYAGNKTVMNMNGAEEWVGDTDAPYFADPSYLYNNVRAGSNGSKNIDFEWSQAYDQGDVALNTGVSHYVVIISADVNGDGQVEEVYRQVVNGQKNTSTTINTADAGLDLTKDCNYTWRVEAYDFGGNKTNTQAGHFVIDNTPPTGTFDNDSDCSMTCTWSTRLESEGSLSSAEMVSYISSIRIACDWSARFTDETSAVRYEVQICDDPTFYGKNLKTYYTDDTSIVFDNGNSSNNGNFNAGELLGMKKLYWRVRAVDESGNASDVWFLGNNGKALNLYDENHLDEDGDPCYIFDNTAPVVSGIASIAPDGDGAVKIGWSRANDAFGIKEYRLQLVRSKAFDASVNVQEYFSINPEFSNVAKITKTDSRIYNIITDTGNNYVMLQGLPDGVYSLYVKAVDYRNNANDSVKLLDNVVVDTTAPVLDCKSVVSDVAVSDVNFSWKAAYDIVGVDHYIFTYKKFDEKDGFEWVQNIKLDGKATSFRLNNLEIGKYCFTLQAFDGSGHASDVFGYIDNENDVVEESIFTIENTDAGNSMGAATVMVSGKVYEDAVNYVDTKDFYALQLASAADVDIELGKVTTLGGGRGGVRLEIYNAAGRRIKSLSVPSGTKKYTYMLDAGKYYLCVVPARGKTSVSYTIEADVDYFPAATLNDTSKLFRQNKLTATPLKDNGNTGSLKIDGWVGFGDGEDYIAVTASASAYTTIKVDGLDARATVALYDANKRRIKLLRMTDDGTLYSGYLGGTYYLSITSGDNGRGKYNTDYSFDINAAYVRQDTVANDTKAQAAANATALSVSNKLSGWVGIGDVSDIYKFTNATGEELNFNVSGVSGRLKLTVYDSNFKRVKTAVVSKDGNYLKDLLIDGDFYVEVASADNGRRQHSNYDITINAEIFPEDTVANDTKAQAAANATALSSSNKVSGWVGIGDVSDIYKFTNAGGEELNFNISGVSGRLKLTVYDSNFKRVRTAVVSKDGNCLKDLLVKGDFYVEVASADNGRRQHSYYDLTVNAELFPVEKVANNSRNTAADLTKAGQSGVVQAWDGAEALVEDWVGFGDKSDYFAFEMDSASKVDFDLSLDDASLKVGRAVKVTLYNAAGKRVSLDADLTSRKELEIGKYFVAVETTNEKKNISGYKLDMSIC